MCRRKTLVRYSLYMEEHKVKFYIEIHMLYYHQANNELCVYSQETKTPRKCDRGVFMTIFLVIIFPLCRRCLSIFQQNSLYIK